MSHVNGLQNVLAASQIATLPSKDNDADVAASDLSKSVARMSLQQSSSSSEKLATILIKERKWFDACFSQICRCSNTVRCGSGS